MKCPNCGGTRFSWDAHQVTTIPPTGSQVPAPKIFLACDECSEMVRTYRLDDVADFLNRLGITAAQTDRHLLEAPVAAVVFLVDLVPHAIANYGGRDKAEYVFGRQLGEHDYRFEVILPQGGTVSFNTGATAADVADMLRRQGVEL